MSSQVYDVPALDKTNRQLHVFWPSVEKLKAQNQMVKFPLVSYMHGMSGGGPVDLVAYRQLFEDISSFGGAAGPVYGRIAE